MAAAEPSPLFFAKNLASWRRWLRAQVHPTSARARVLTLAREPDSQFYLGAVVRRTQTYFARTALPTPKA